MTGQPVKWTMLHHMADKATQSLPDLPPDMTTEDKALAYLLAVTEDGQSLLKVAQSLNVSRFLLSRWVKGDDERYKAYARARALSADSLVDRGGELLDTATRETIQQHRAQAEWRKWLAGKYDPQSYGDAQAPQVQVNTLHYHAALSRPPIQQIAPPSMGPLTVAKAGYPTEVKTLPPSSEAGE